MNVTRIFDLLDYCLENHPRKDAFASCVNGEWKTVSTQEYAQTVNFLSCALLAHGIKKGDCIVTVSENRPQWNFVDMAIMQTGAIHVPVYPTISCDDYKFILNHCTPRIIFVSDKKALSRIEQAAQGLSFIEKIYTFENIENYSNMEQLRQEGEKCAVYYADELKKIKDSVLVQDTASIIYTSGTTGLSKGVMLSHNNFVSNFKATKKIPALTSEDRVLSILPLCHVYERCFCYVYQYSGVGIYYAQNLATITRDLCQLHCSPGNTVPRILENIFNKIFADGRNLKGMKKRLFDNAVSHGYKFEHNNANGLIYSIKQKFYDFTVYRGWRKNYFGGNAKFLGCGGAALALSFSRLCWAAGLHVQEGYGLTETSPVIAHSLRTSFGHKFTAVGPILDGLDVKIDEDGEILIKGPNVMKGYYKNPELTSAAFNQDGYFRTGDIGYISSGNHLHITDRKKDVFKTSAGKYIAPQMLEGKFKESPYINQIMVVGENQKFASAVISPDFSACESFLTQNGISGLTNQDIINNELIKELFSKEVKRINMKNGQTEEIKRFKLVPDTWTTESGLLSQTQKLKRKAVVEKYSRLIEEIYN